MYILSEQPADGESRRAFQALDDAFGADEFAREAAERVLTDHGFRGSSMFETLESYDYITEVG